MAKAVKAPAARRLPAAQKALILKIRQTAAEYFDAEDQDGYLEQYGTKREWLRAKSATQRAYKRFEKLTREVMAMPVRSWADVAVLAELAKAHQPETGKVTDKNTGKEFYLGIHSQVLCSVLDGALHMAGSSRCPGLICDSATSYYG
jgi:hypothetical protein